MVHPILRRKIRYGIFGLAASVLLSGCAGLPEVKHGEIILDTKRHLLCYSIPYDCYELSLIVAHFERDRVLRLHGLDPWDYSQLDTVSEFVDLLTKPTDGQRPQQITKFIYRLPVNEKNMEAWNLLYEEYERRGFGYGTSSI